MKLLIPSYIYSTLPDWSKIIGSGDEVWGVVLNFANGPGPSSHDPNNDKLRAKLSQTGLEVFGYVSTRWASRPMDECKADIATWFREWDVDDIFLDEASTDEAGLGFYATLNCYIRGRSVLNHGTAPDPRYIKAGDILCTAETELPSYSSKAFGGWDRLNKKRLYHIVMGVPLNSVSPVLSKAAQFADYVYVTDLVEPEAYTKLPSYYSRLLQKLRNV